MIETGWEGSTYDGREGRSWITTKGTAKKVLKTARARDQDAVNESASDSGGGETLKCFVVSSACLRSSLCPI